jgi:hypothetical protein
MTTETDAKVNAKINAPLNPEERLKLDHLIRNTDNFQDNTEHIRKVKHSKQLITSVGIIEKLKIHYADIRVRDNAEFNELCRDKCSFFYNNYTDIFNKLVNDELDLQILSQFLQVLRAIEENKVDQNEGSVIVGKLLKELYIDAALKRSSKLEQQDHVDDNGEPLHTTDIVCRGVSWEEFKKNRDYLMRTPSH